MPTPLGYNTGYCASTPVTNLYTLVIDTGIVASSVSPSGKGFELVALGMVGFSGTTAPVTLP